MTEASKSKAQPDTEKHGEAVRVRCTKKELQALDKSWRAAGFKSRSAFIRHLIRQEIEAPTTTPALLDEVRGIKTQLAAVGRNLNQTVRAINEQRKKGVKFDPRAHLEPEDIEGLRAVVRSVRDALGSFVTGVRDKRVG